MTLVQRTKEFLREVQTEMKRVSFPTRRETLGATMAVIMFVLVLSVFLAFTDVVLSHLVAKVIR